jgi:hypothetical protein
MVGKGWFNSGYIFPAGFKSRLLFRCGAGACEGADRPGAGCVPLLPHPAAPMLPNALLRQTPCRGKKSSRRPRRSSVDLDALTLHECEIVGAGGAFWPAPTFVVTARDRPGEPMVARSCTGCWSGVSATGARGAPGRRRLCSLPCQALPLLCNSCLPLNRCPQPPLPRPNRPLKRS